jgi:hypothetical protein
MLVAFWCLRPPNGLLQSWDIQRTIRNRNAGQTKKVHCDLFKIKSQLNVAH